MRMGLYLYEESKQPGFRGKGNVKSKASKTKTDFCCVCLCLPVSVEFSVSDTAEVTLMSQEPGASWGPRHIRECITWQTEGRRQPWPSVGEEQAIAS